MTTHQERIKIKDNIDSKLVLQKQVFMSIKFHAENNCFQLIFNFFKCHKMKFKIFFAFAYQLLIVVNSQLGKHVCLIAYVVYKKVFLYLQLNLQNLQEKLFVVNLVFLFQTMENVVKKQKHPIKLHLIMKLENGLGWEAWDIGQIKAFGTTNVGQL